MKPDKAIFGLRFGTNEELVPAPDELNDFLENTQRNDGQGPQGSDLIPYRLLLRDVVAFERQPRHGTTQRDFHDIMFYGVLRHSSFFSNMLLLSVAQYKYHLNTLRSLDFKKPTAFVRSAEEAMGKLDPNRKADAVKLARMRDMVDERNKTLTKLNKRWTALIAELGDIALYIRDNLIMIEHVCEGAIVVLAELQVGQQKERELIEDIKTTIKEHLRDCLRQGSITKEHLEAAKKEVATLSQEMSSLFRDDLHALAGLFEALYDHTRKCSREIDTLTGKMSSRKGLSLEECRDIVSQIEGALVSLVSEFHFEIKPSRIRTTTAYENMLVEKRKETLEYLFALVKKERRSETNRRSGEDRRKFDDPDYAGPERRNNKNRRIGKKIRYC